MHRRLRPRSGRLLMKCCSTVATTGTINHSLLCPLFINKYITVDLHVAKTTLSKMHTDCLNVISPAVGQDADGTSAYFFFRWRTNDLLHPLLVLRYLCTPGHRADYRTALWRVWVERRSSRSLILRGWMKTWHLCCWYWSWPNPILLCVISRNGKTTGGDPESSAVWSEPDPTGQLPVGLTHQKGLRATRSKHPVNYQSTSVSMSDPFILTTLTVTYLGQ